MVVFEAARGAGHDPAHRDDYAEGLFGPLIDQLPSEVVVVNFEVVLPDRETLMARARLREAEVPGATPAFVTEKYLVEGRGGPYCSAVDELAAMGLDGKVAINRQVINGDREDLVDLVEEIRGEVEWVLRPGMGEGNYRRGVEG